MYKGTMKAWIFHLTSKYQNSMLTLHIVAAGIKIELDIWLTAFQIRMWGKMIYWNRICCERCKKQILNTKNVQRYDEYKNFFLNTKVPKFLSNIAYCSCRNKNRAWHLVDSFSDQNARKNDWLKQNLLREI